ncbi:MAG: hypothetical protein EP297_09700 [Gammaproteobacteria bacterium]|nr:MAG: hypothetical protein EP297_09700 [Gammaproteobacteria bacterium]
MNPFDKVDDPRRRVLIEALALGLFTTSSMTSNALAWSLFGDKPKKMPAGKSIYKLTGSASVNGKAASLATSVRPGDTVETGKNSEIIFVVGGHSMILRSETRLVIEGKKETESLLIQGLRLLTGKLLSVSRDSPMRFATPTATIGIRGTGWYAEADPEKTYFCTCYGKTDIEASNDPSSKETVVAEHHDRPVYILGDSESGRSIRDAPFINHTDQELALIETLVGRTPPFIFPEDDYSGPRRDY